MARDREKAIIYHREYRKNNPEKLREIRARYYAKRGTTQSEYMKAYYLLNRNKLLKQKKDFRKNNPEVVRARHIARAHLECLRGARSRANKIGVPYELNKEWAEEHWTGKCEVTGIEFQCGVGKNGPYSPSIDRVDPSLGYTKENCRYIIFGINLLKHTGTDDDVLLMCEKVVENKHRLRTKQ